MSRRPICPPGRQSGLRHVIGVLRGVDGVAFTFFDAQDVVRHPLVQRIVQAYEAQEPRERSVTLQVDVQRASKRWAPRARDIAHLGARRARPARRRRRAGVRVVGSAESRRLNARYRGKDKPTNVLSFPAAHCPPRPGPAQRTGRSGSGDLRQVRARRGARSSASRCEAHWAHLVVHGALHLIGYDHEREAEARRMERREIAVLHRLGFTNPYRSLSHGARTSTRPGKLAQAAHADASPASRRTASSCSRSCARRARAACSTPRRCRCSKGVLEVADLQVRDIMVPRAQMVFVRRDDPASRILPTVVESGHSRFPVMDDDRDDIVGILLAKDLLRLCAPRRASASTSASSCVRRCSCRSRSGSTCC